MGKNIQALTKREILKLSDIFYVVAGENDYVTDFEAVKKVLQLHDMSYWNESILSAGATNYIDTLVDSTVYGVIKIEYLAKRGTRTYRSGLLTVMYDSAQVVWNDFWDVTSSDADDLGLTLTAQLSGSNIQLICTVDGSDANDITLNWKITVKKPITIT